MKELVLVVGMICCMGGLSYVSKSLLLVDTRGRPLSYYEVDFDYPKK